MDPDLTQDLSLDALFFFTTHAAVVVSACALVFFLLGLYVGYLSWAKFKRRARAYFEEIQLQRSEIANLKRRIAHESSETSLLEEAVTPLRPAETVLALPKPPPAPEVPVTKRSLADVVLGRTAPTPKKVETPPTPQIDLPAVPPPATPPAPVLEPEAVPVVVTAPPPAEKPSTGPLAQAIVRSMEDDTTHPSSSNGIAHPAPEPEAPDEVDPLATALLSGHAARDEKLGLVFHSRPERYDDLTLLRGIGDALHTKLQEHGIYTFRQIALWTEEHIREFDSRLVAKDRIRREQWVKQARNLHFLKYGEQIKTLEGETTP